MTIYKFSADTTIESNDINEALGQFAVQLWFPGIIMAREYKGLDKIGEPVNLRTLTDIGKSWEESHQKNYQGRNYGQVALVTLVKTCENLHLKKFEYNEEGNCLVELNSVGMEIQEKSIEEMKTHRRNC